MTYEKQPPSYTALKLLSGPPRGGGGDTHWASQYTLYDVLSPPMQAYLSTLTALHSADMQAQGSRDAGRPVRRDPITTEHPLVRTHPVTGWKALFFNPGFVTQIVGVPRLESDAIIAYLREVVATTQEAHVRFQWGKNDVAFWDNRICVRSWLSCDGFEPFTDLTPAEPFGILRLRPAPPPRRARRRAGREAILRPERYLSGAGVRGQVRAAGRQQGRLGQGQLQRLKRNSVSFSGRGETGNLTGVTKMAHPASLVPCFFETAVKRDEMMAGLDLRRARKGDLAWALA